MTVCLFRQNWHIVCVSLCDRCIVSTSPPVLLLQICHLDCGENDQLTLMVEYDTLSGCLCQTVWCTLSCIDLLTLLAGITH